MGIAGLSSWLKDLLPGNSPAPQVPHPQPAHHQQPSTIQPGVPLPTFQPGPDNTYSVQGLAPGASTFADYQGLGVLRNPPRGVVYFDPTGQANDQNAHGYKGNYLAVPMAQPDFKPMPYLQQIGGR